MSTKDFLNIGLETTKGSALQSLKDEGAAGAFDFAVLNFTGILVDQEVFGLARDLYEFNLIATDNTLDTGTGGEYNNTAPGPIQVPLTSAQVAAGDVILIESEFFKVVDTGVSSSTVVRGYAGSTIAAHGNSVTIFEAVQQIDASSNFAVPISTTAQATAKAEVSAAVNYFVVGANERLGRGTAKVDQAGLIVEAVVGGGTDAVVFALPANKGVPASSDGTFAPQVDFIIQAGQDDLLRRTDGGSWLDDGVRVGQVLTVTNAVDGGNNVAHTVNAVDDTDLSTSVSVTAALADDIDCASDVGQTNATLTVFGGGVEVASQKYSSIFYVWTAADDTAGFKEFYAPFDVVEAFCSAYDADGGPLTFQTGTDEQDWDGTVTVSASRLVRVTEGTTVALAALDMIKVEFFG